MTNIRTKKRLTSICADTLGEWRSDSTGTIKWWQTNAEEVDDKDEPALKAATYQTIRKRKCPQLETTESLQVVQDDGSFMMKG